MNKKIFTVALTTLALVACGGKGSEVTADEFAKKADAIEVPEEVQGVKIHVEYSIVSNLTYNNETKELVNVSDSSDATYTLSDDAVTTTAELNDEVDELVKYLGYDADYLADLIEEGKTSLEGYKFYVNPLGFSYTIDIAASESNASATKSDLYVRLNDNGLVSSINYDGTVTVDALGGVTKTVIHFAVTASY